MQFGVKSKVTPCETPGCSFFPYGRYQVHYLPRFAVDNYKLAKCDLHSFRITPFLQQEVEQGKLFAEKKYKKCHSGNPGGRQKRKIGRLEG